MNKDERSLLLYLETRCVDYGGRVDGRHMNDADRDSVQMWNETGFIKYGRICFEDIERMGKYGQPTTNWVELSEAAWAKAHELRRERYTHGAMNRTWKKTTEV